MEINNIFQSMKLKDLVEVIRKLNESGNNVHIEGVGNGKIRVVMDYIEIK